MEIEEENHFNGLTWCAAEERSVFWEVDDRRRRYDADSFVLQVNNNYKDTAIGFSGSDPNRYSTTKQWSDPCSDMLTRIINKFQSIKVENRCHGLMESRNDNRERMVCSHMKFNSTRDDIQGLLFL